MPVDCAPVTIEEFLAEFPEFSALPSAVVEAQLNRAMRAMNKAEWADFWRDAVKLLAAHTLATRYNISARAAELGKRSAYSAGFATSQSASPGRLSVSKQLPAWMTGDDPFVSWMAATDYGQEWLALLVMVIPPVGVVWSSPVTSGLSNYYAEFIGVRGI